MAVLHALRDGEVVRVQAIDAVGTRISALDGGSEVALSIGRTATLDRVNDMPILWIPRGGLVLGVAVEETELT